MKKYLGTKLVTAKPMTRAEAEVILGKSIKPAKQEYSGEGYLVRYEDGYQSWSPKEVFDEAYKPADNFLDRLIIERDEVQQRLSSLTSALMQEDFQEKVGSKQYYWMQESATQWKSTLRCSISESRTPSTTSSPCKVS